MEGFLAEEINPVKENLMKALASGDKSWKDSYKIKCYDGSIASVTSRASIVRNEEGTAIRLIGATQDVSSIQELEKKLKEQLQCTRKTRINSFSQLNFPLM
jgi:PAS domain S-box-containing protein